MDTVRSRMVKVYDLNDLEKELVYVGISPQTAVVCAYAQSKLDFNTWEYEFKYGALISVGKFTVSCGNYVALYKCYSCGMEFETTPVNLTKIGKGFVCDSCSLELISKFSKYTGITMASILFYLNIDDDGKQL